MKTFKLLFIAFVAMTGLTCCSKDCGHDFIEHDYSNDILGTWSIIGPDYAEALVINADGTMDLTAVHEGEYFETRARYELANNRMKIIWDDGTIDEGRLDVVPGNLFLMTVDEETGAALYYAYCYEDLSDEMVGSWLLQSDMTSEIHTYNADGTTGCLAYYYHLDEQYETFVSGTYKVVGDILFETVKYAEDAVLSFASRISYTPGSSPFGDVMTSTSLGIEEDELQEYVDNVVRVKPSLDLAGKKYNYSDCSVTNVKGEDMDVEFMGYTFNFSNMDGSGLDLMLKTLSFNIEFKGAETLCYSYKYNNGKETFEVPVVADGNKMIVKMSEKVPTLKDIVFYAFQGEDCNQMHLCMDKTAYVNFYTNMQAMLMESSGEQFDITDEDSVNAIYNNIDNAVETIKLSLEFKAD